MTGGARAGDTTRLTEDLPAYLRRTMRDAGYRTITAFANAAEMDVSQLNKILNGRTRPTVETLVRLARALKRPPAEVARAGGYPAVPESAERRIEDQTLRELLLLLQEDEAFMAEFARAKPLDEEALRDMADLLRPYLAGMRRAHAARARPRRDAGPGAEPPPV